MLAAFRLVRPDDRQDAFVARVDPYIALPDDDHPVAAARRGGRAGRLAPMVRASPAVVVFPCGWWEREAGTDDTNEGGAPMPKPTSGGRADGALSL